MCLNLTNVMVHSDIFAITFAVLTMYTLFAPDILLVFGLSTEHTQSLAIANTVVLFFFCVEAPCPTRKACSGIVFRRFERGSAQACHWEVSAQETHQHTLQT